MIRGIRGATTVEFNTEEGIVSAVKELLLTIFDKNNVVKDDIAAIIFSSTRDITAAFPAKAARQLGLEYTALFGCSEMDCDTDIAMCIRVLVLSNMSVSQKDIMHVYLNKARCLRPDINN